MITPVAIDTDPGVDDAIALMLAMRSPEISVELLTTVAGNVPVHIATRNAKRLVALVDPETWPVVAEGCAAPLAGPLTTAAHVHGRDGLGGCAVHYPVPARLRTRKDGVQQLVEFTRRHGERGLIVALGPLTNVARAMQVAPDVMRTLGRLVVMGGAVREPGNVSEVAEFNVFVDPEAADEVLRFGVETTLIPLDVTRQVILTEQRISDLGRHRLALAAKRFTRAAAGKFGGMPMHDSLAVAVGVDPSLVGSEILRMSVETDGSLTRGMTVADRRASASNAKTGIVVASTVNADGVLSMLEQRVFSRGPVVERDDNGRVTVVGSANIDLSIGVRSLPSAGETVLGDTMVRAFGGKGANQAVAARRAGADVSLVARFGDDDFANDFLGFLAREGIDTRASTRDGSVGTGVAMITVSESGENQIAVGSGANANLTVRALGSALDRIADADVLVTQLEIPLRTVTRALQAARKHGVVTVHNPAPAQPLDDDFLRLIDVLVCNEVEAQMLARTPVRTVADAGRAASALRGKGIARVVVTLGAQGLVYLEAVSDRPVHIDARRVKAVDTTGAGDTFVGYLAAALAAKTALRPALELANRAAGQSVMQRGAVPSIPTRDSLSD